MAETIAITPVALRNESNAVTQSLLEAGYRVVTHPEIVPPTPEEQRALLQDAVGIILGPETLGRDAMAAAPRLRFISRFGVGYDNIDLDGATDLGIVVTYVPDAMVEAVADITLGLLLASSRRIAEFDAALKAGRWNRIIASDVSGQTLGLVGTGRIGLAVARRARAFGMRLVGCDVHRNPLFTEELGGDYLPFELVLETADFVSLHAPATPETKGMMNAAALARMKPGSFLINAARGSLVDEEALLSALDSGHLAGAGLDVFSSEPPLAGSAAERLTKHAKVVATPHVASFTPVTAARMGKAALDNLMACLRGERPANVANPQVYERPLRATG